MSATGSTFEDNEASKQGGAIFGQKFINFDVESSTFANNAASSGSAMYVTNSRTNALVLDDVEIVTETPTNSLYLASTIIEITGGTFSQSSDETLDA